MEQHKSLAIGLIIGVVILFGVLLYLLKFSSLTQKGNGAAVTRRQYPSPTPAGNGMMSLSLKDAQTAKVGVPFTVVVSVSSDNQAVGGADAFISYDATKLRYVSQQSLLTDFDTLEPKGNPGTVHILAIKKLASKTSSIFNDTQIVEATFTPTAPGTVAFTLGNGIEFHSTIVTDEKTPKNILGHVTGVTVAVSP